MTYASGVLKKGTVNGYRKCTVSIIPHFYFTGTHTLSPFSKNRKVSMGTENWNGIASTEMKSILMSL